MSIRRPGWPMCLVGSQGTRPASSTSCCRGTGRPARRGATRPPEMAAISAVFTISHVAALLGEDEAWLHDLSINMFPEDGCLHVYGVGEDGVTAFTQDGIDNLKQIIEDEREAETAPPKPGNPG